MSNDELRRLRAMSGDELLDALAASERRLASVQAEQLQILALLEQQPSTVTLSGYDDKHWVREQVACVLNCSPELAGYRLTQADRLDRLPDAIDMLDQSQVSYPQLRVLADKLESLDASGDLPDDTAAAIATRVLPNAAGQSLSAFRAAVNRAALVHAPRTDAQQREHNVSERRVQFAPHATGVTSMWALLPDEQAAAIAATLTSYAATAPADDERTADQRRADALVHLILNGPGTAADWELPRRIRLRPAVSVTVAASTLALLDDQPGELDGVGPIPANLARAIAHDPTGTWRRLVTDPVGRLVDYGRSTCRPPVALADHVNARDRICRYPNCNRRATINGRHAGEIDHLVPWADGGHTNEPNLHVLCARHHHLKDETRWRVTREADGTTTWTDHTGRSYTKPADPYPIDTTSDHARNSFNEAGRGTGTNSGDDDEARGSPTAEAA